MEVEERQFSLWSKAQVYYQPPKTPRPNCPHPPQSHLSLSLYLYVYTIYILYPAVNFLSHRSSSIRTSQLSSKSKTPTMASSLSSFPLIILVLVISMLMSLHTAECVEFDVGGDKGWATPPSKNQLFYNDWASNNRFKVNDTLRKYINYFSINSINHNFSLINFHLEFSIWFYF